MGILPLKEIAQISKAKLTLAVGLAENYKIINEEFIDPERMSSLNNSSSEYEEVFSGESFSSYTSSQEPQDFKETPFYEAVKRVSFAKPLNTASKKNIRIEEITSYDSDTLNPVKTKVIYINEWHSLRITEKVETKRLSKLQLLQYILYHFYAVDSNGIIKNIPVKEVAKVLGCSVNTVNNNNEALAELGFIAISKIDASLFNIIILGYKDNRKTRDEKGTGYIQMPKGMLLEMMEIKHVNSLRLAIRQYIKCDNNEGIKSTPSSEYSFSEFKFFLPKSLCYKKKILETLKETEKFFTQSRIDNSVYFTLKEEYNGKKVRALKEEECREEISRFLVESDLTFMINSIEDLTKLSMEYGREHLKVAIDNLSSLPNPSEIENIGGYLRQQIRKEIQDRISKNYRIKKNYRKIGEDKNKVA